MLLTIVLLYNFKANKVGLNQILNIYICLHYPNMPTTTYSRSINNLVHNYMLPYLLHLL